ncbi:glycosyltransferase [Sulfurimonas paralvinellae]|uniref:Glycosyltransferase n=1 Tax=Sulfurimonas paralvinellae TaxID=317658 RepID=A0A7M1B8X6_9BACT|nr:glycosyltransferase [Sulfurimonas paralvinellae]QOP46125.1 glycosyltransferase [Sulfurimonas paralvinellae]
MRVAVVVRSLKIGGMERSAINIAQAFADEGHESHLIYFRSKNAALKPKENVYLHHFDIEKFMKLSVIGLVWMIYCKLANILIRHSYFFWHGMFASWIFKYKIYQLERKYGKFDLIILRGQGTFESVWMLKDDRLKQVSVSMFIFTGGIIKNFFLRRLYDQKHIIAISNGIKRKIEEVAKIAHFQPKSLNVIYNPMDVALVRQRALEYVPDIDEEYILYFGRITPNKNVGLLIDAYNYAKTKLSLNKKLVIIGNGPKYEDIKKQIQSYSLEDDIIMLGALSNPYPWVKAAKLVVFTSKAEGLGNVLLETLACHTPIVSVKTVGGPEDIMCGELRHYRVDFDKEVLATKIVEVLKNGVDIDFDKYLQKFQPAFVVQRFKEVYHL